MCGNPDSKQDRYINTLSSFGKHIITMAVVLFVCLTLFACTTVYAGVQHDVRTVLDGSRKFVIFLPLYKYKNGEF